MESELKHTWTLILAFYTCPLMKNNKFKGGLMK